MKNDLNEEIIIEKVGELNELAAQDVSKRRKSRLEKNVAALGYPMGAVKRLDMYEKGVVSSLYICFALSSNEVDSEFISQYFESGNFNHEIYKIAQEGARNHGLLNISVPDFFHTDLFLPTLPEQKKIAAVLKNCDEEIDLLKEKLAKFKSQKKGLMQKLLTGEVRVKVS